MLIEVIKTVNVDIEKISDKLYGMILKKFNSQNEVKSIKDYYNEHLIECKDFVYTLINKKYRGVDLGTHDQIYEEVELRLFILFES